MSTLCIFFIYILHIYEYIFISFLADDVDVNIEKSVMPPRLSVRRFFLCLLCCGGVLLVLVIYHHRSFLAAVDPYTFGSDGASPQSIYDATESWDPEPGDSHGKHGLPQAEDVPPGKRHWYFSGGTEFPEKTPGPHKLFPYNDPGDRVLEQLMYLPDDFEGK